MPDDPIYDDSGTQAEQAFVARKQQDSDAALAQAYLAAHPEAGSKYGIQQISLPPPDKIEKPPPASDGSTPSTGAYQGTDLLGNPVTLTEGQRREAASGAMTGLDQPFAKAHPNVATVHNLLPLIGLAMGVGKLASNLAGAAAAEPVGRRCARHRLRPQPCSRRRGRPLLARPRGAAGRDRSRRRRDDRDRSRRQRSPPRPGRRRRGSLPADSRSGSMPCR